MPKVSDDSEIVMRVSEHLVKENFRVLDLQKVKYGKTLSDRMTTHFIACFVGAAIHKVLQDCPENIKTVEGRFKHVKKNFGAIKLSVQESIAAAFSAAMGEFTGKNIEYYCRITVVGEPANKKEI